MQSGAIYARISKVLDPEDTLGVQRQVEDCQRGASRRGDRITRTYTDNDFSATTGKLRPSYERMLQALRDGAHDGVWVWDLDRLHRRPIELEEFIALADKHRLDLASVGGEVDLATPQGRLTARIKGAVAKAEAEMMSRRLRRKHQELADAGKPHGGTRAFGYAKDGQTVIPEEAAIAQELAARVLCGETLAVLARDLNERGVPTVTGKQWRRLTIKQILTAPRIAGLREHRGGIVGPAAWPAILDNATWQAVRAILSRTDRRPPGMTNIRKHLLSGIVRCGLCRQPLQIARSSRNSSGGPLDGYRCVNPTCRKVRIARRQLDDMVADLVIRKLEREHVEPYGDDDDDQRLARLDAALATVDTRLEEAGREFARDKSMPPSVVRAIVIELTTERERTEAERSALQADRAWSDALDGLDPSEVRELWERGELSLARKRGIIAKVTRDTLVVFPATVRGRGFDPARVSVLAWERNRRGGVRS